MIYFGTDHCIQYGNKLWVTRFGLTQETGSAIEKGTIPLYGTVVVPILWNDFTLSKLQTSRKKS